MKLTTITLLVILISCSCKNKEMPDITFCTHKVILDEKDKIIPWYTPNDMAYDHFLHLRWDYIKTKVPNSPGPEPRSL